MRYYFIYYVCLIVLFVIFTESNYVGEIPSLDENSTDYNDIESNKTGRILSLNAFMKFTEQFGNLFLNTDKKPDTSTSNTQDNNKIPNSDNTLNIPNTLYSISENVFGNNITKLLAPLVNKILPNNNNLKKETDKKKEEQINKKDTILEIDLNGLKVANNFSIFNFDIKMVNDTLRCRTPSEDEGICLSLSHCPSLILNVENFRKSICFANPLTPGVCCPKNLIIYNFTDTNSKYPLNNKIINYNQSTSRNDILDINDCGLPKLNSFRIVGGEESFENQWPWIVAIYIIDIHRKPNKYCGGTIIHPKFVLTAAHCLENKLGLKFPVSRYLVRIGVTNLDLDNGYWYKVSKVIGHERFIRMNYLNDIALLKLTKPIEKRTNSIPICLPEANLSEGFFYGQQSTILGWGNTEHRGNESPNLKYAVVPIWAHEECNQQAGYYEITTNQFCAGYYDGGIDACQGDSGGPLILFYGNRWKQIGIISYGIDCAKPLKPGVYTKVSKYLNWINKKIEDNL